MKKAMKFLAVTFTLALIAVNLQLPTVNAQGRTQLDCEPGHTCTETELFTGCRYPGSDCLVVKPNDK